MAGTSLASNLSDRNKLRDLSGTLADQKAITSMLANIERSNIDTSKALESPQKDPIFVRLVDFISRPNYGSAAAADKLNKGGNIGEAADEFVAGLAGKRKITYSEVLKNKGVGEGGSFNAPLIGKVTERGAEGLALDVLLDPLTYVSFGTGTLVKTALKGVGKAGAKKLLTRVGEKALVEGAAKTLEKMTLDATIERLGRKTAERAAGRASAASIQKAARKLVMSGAVEMSPLLEKQALKEATEQLIKEGGKEMFEQGGIALEIPFTKIKKTLVPGERIAQVVSDINKGGRKIPLAGSVFGNTVDYSQKAIDVVKDITGSIFSPGHEYTKQLRELTASKKLAAKAMGFSDEEALKVFPELSKNVEEALQFVAKNKRFAAQQGYKTMVDMFGAVNPEEGKVLAMALEGIPGSVEKLSPMGKQAFEATRSLMKDIGVEQLEYGFINKMVDNFTPRFLTEEAKNYLKENMGTTNSALAGLIKVFAPARNAERVLIKDGDKIAMIKAAGSKAKDQFLDDAYSKTLKKIEVLNKELEQKLGKGSKNLMSSIEKKRLVNYKNILKSIASKRDVLVDQYINDKNLKKLLKDTSMTDLDIAKLADANIDDTLLAKLEKEIKIADSKLQVSTSRLEKELTQRTVSLEARTQSTYLRGKKKLLDRLETDIVDQATKKEALAMQLKKFKLDKKFSSEFFGEKLSVNTIEEVNEIAAKKLGFSWFEDDLTRALPRYYTRFLTNKAMFDGLKDLPRLVNDSSGVEIFRDVVDSTLPGYEKFKLPQLEGKQAPKFLVDQIEKTYTVLASDKQLNKFIKMYDKALGTFKFGVTAPWPTFHTQNYIGGQFSNFIYGLTPGSPKWMRRSRQALNMFGETNLDKKVGEGAVKDMTFGQLKELYDRYGGSGGFFGGDVGDSVYRKVFSSKEPLHRNVGQKVAEKLGGAGAAVENVNRWPIFIEEMVKHGDPMRASKQVFQYHFDYAPEAYTAVEREVFQRLIPFYRFMRGNIPLQLNALHSETARMTSVIKTIRDLSADSEKDKPEWLRKTFSIPLDGPGSQLFKKNKGDKVFATLPIPLAELARVEPRQLMSSMTPFLKVPIEMITNQELFFGNHIYNPDLPPEMRTSKAYSILKGLVSLPGVGPALGEFMNWREKPVMDPMTRQLTGDTYFEADSQKLYLLRSILGPVSRGYMLFGQMPDDTTAQGISSLFLPSNIVRSNPAEQQVWDIRQKRQELATLVGWLKARNLYTDANGDTDRKVPIQTPQAQEYLNQLVRN